MSDKRKFESKIREIAAALVRYRFYSFLIVTILLLSEIIWLPTPKFTGSLAGFKLENNTHFIQYQIADSLFNNKIKIYLVVKPSTDQRDKFFKGVNSFATDIKSLFPDANVVTPVKFYKVMGKEFNTEDNSLMTFFDRATRIPVLKQIVAKDLSSILIVVHLNKFENEDLISLNKVTNKKYDGFDKIRAISALHIEHSVRNFIIKDIRRIVVLILLSFLIFFLIVFKSLLSSIFTLIMVSFSLTATLMLYSLMGFDINLISVLAIPIVLILSISDCMHLMSGFINNEKNIDKSRRTKEVIIKFLIPSIFSSLTTSAAFFSFYVFNDSPYIREFGLIAALGLIAEVFIVFTIGPILLRLFNLRKINETPFKFVTLKLFSYRKPVSYCLLTILVISVFLTDRLEFKSSSEIFFPTGSEIKEVHEELRQNYASNLVMNVLVRSENDSIVHHSELRDYVKALSSDFAKNKIVTEVNSATNNYFYSPSFGPPVNLYSILGDESPYFSDKNQTYKIELKFPSADDMVKFQKSDLKKLIEGSPKSITVNYSGLPILMDEVNRSVAISLLKSLFTSIAVIFLMILLLTGSVKLSFFSLAPNIVPLAFIVVVLLIFNISINIVTAITAVICLGLLDDDTIHILYRRLWLKEPMQELSFSILSSAFLLIIGFGTFLLSSFRPIQILGLVSSMVFAIGVISEMTLMQWVLDQSIKIKSRDD